MAHADARRRTGGDQIAGPERKEFAEITDDLRDTENHGLGIAGLHPLAVQF